MLYNSFIFGIFFTVVWTFLFVIRTHQARKLVLLSASLIFYGWWDPRFVLLILASVAIDYLCALAIQGRRKQAWIFLSLSLLANLGILGYFKYLYFFADLFDWTIPPGAIQIILPIGISFYTFQSMSYTIDVYREKIEAEKNPLNVALFVSFFPQLVAGPIVRAGELLPQLKSPYKLTLENIEKGIPYFLAGLVCKVVIADSLHPLTIERFAEVGSQGIQIWLTGQLYIVMLYYDFAGYSLMAIGLARFLGINLPQNFRSPFAAHSIADIWRRWHISLSQWVRDYIFRPVYARLNQGLQKKISHDRFRGFISYSSAVLIAMTLMGFWHGAHMTFLIWGFLFGAAILVDRIMFQHWDVKYSKVNRTFGVMAYVTFRRLYTFILFGLSMVLFNYSFIPNPDTYFETTWNLSLDLRTTDFAVLGVIIAAFIVHNISRDEDIILRALQGRATIFTATLCLLALFYVKTEPIQYVYFQF